MALHVLLHLVYFRIARMSAAHLEGNLHLFLISQSHLGLPFCASSNVEAAKFSTYAVLHMLKGFDCKQPVLQTSKIREKSCNHFNVKILNIVMYVTNSTFSQKSAMLY